MATVSVPRPARTGAATRLGAEYGVVAALVIMIVAFSVLRPDTFATLDNLKAVLSQWAPVAVLAFGVTVVLVMEDFDLSLIGIITVTSGIVVSLMSTSGLPVPVALAVMFAVAAALGLLNGVLIAGLGVSSFVITLASGEIFRGLDLQITGGKTIFSGIPSGYLEIGTGETLGLQNSVWIALAVFAVLFLVLEHSQMGRYMYAIGGNREAARLSGISVTRHRCTGFVITALCAAITTVILTGQAGAYSSELAGSYLLPPYAAVFLGAAVFRPGTFNLAGTLVGALFLEVIHTGLTTMSLDTSMILIVQGGVLALSVVLSTIFNRRRP